MIDDEVALLGSDNLNRRSWTHDSELSIAVFDEDRDDRAPTDPGRQGHGARRFARSLRLELEEEHLGSADDLDPAPLATFARWRASADALDAWHEGGRHGSRPPGRVRSHQLEPVRLWQRLYAVPLYHLLIDPDGRPGLPGFRRDLGSRTDRAALITSVRQASPRSGSATGVDHATTRKFVPRGPARSEVPSSSAHHPVGLSAA